MVFPDSVVEQAWKRSDAKCECNRKNCGHNNRCNKSLLWTSRGNDNSEFGWEAHHIDSTGPDTLENCEILCMKCHKNTQSYGGS